MKKFNTTTKKFEPYVEQNLLSAVIAELNKKKITFKVRNNELFVEDNVNVSEIENKL